MEQIVENEKTMKQSVVDRFEKESRQLASVSSELLETKAKLLDTET